jgi:hypothetical protein
MRRHRHGVRQRRVMAAVVLLVAGVSKLARPAQWRSQAAGLGVPWSAGPRRCRSWSWPLARCSWCSGSAAWWRGVPPACSVRSRRCCYCGSRRVCGRRARASGRGVRSPSVPATSRATRPSSSQPILAALALTPRHGLTPVGRCSRASGQLGEQERQHTGLLAPALVAPARAAVAGAHLAAHDAAWRRWCARRAAWRSTSPARGS